MRLDYSLGAIVLGTLLGGSGNDTLDGGADTDILSIWIPAAQAELSDASSLDWIA